MVNLFLSLLFWLPAVLGWGGVLTLSMQGGHFLSSHGKQSDLELRLATVGLHGLALLLSLALFLNFFFALNAFVSLVVYFLGLILFFRRRVRLFSLPKTVKQSSPLSWILLFLLLMLLSAGAATKMSHFDSGLYLVPTMKWTIESSIVPGLANLSPRFGYNSAWPVLAALLDIGFINIHGASIVSLLLMLFVGLLIVSNFRKFFSGSLDLVTIFFVLLSFQWFRAFRSGEIGSLSTDLAVTLIVLSSIGFFINAIARNSKDLLISLVLALMAFSIKLSAIPLLIGISLAFLGFFVKKKLARRDLKVAIVMACIFIVPTLIRGVVLSGCWAYPESRTCFKALSWTVPHYVAEGDAAEIKMWARAPGMQREELKHWTWLGAWKTRVLSQISVKIWIFLALIGVFLFFFRCKKCKKPDLSFFLPLGLSLAGCAFWFFTAPDPRFGYGFLYSLPFLLIGMSIEKIELLKSKKWRARLGALFLFLLMGFSMSRPLSQNEYSLVSWAGMPNYRMEKKQTEEGVVLNIPEQGRNQCWMAELPCVFDPNPELKIQLSERGRYMKFWLEPSM